MRGSSRWLGVVTMLSAAAAPRAVAQASAYLPLDHWTMPHLEYLIRAGVLRDPSPLIRPLRRADAAAALAAADTTRLTPALRALHRRLTAYFATDAAGGVAFRADLFAGLRAATHARRTALRDSGPGDLWPRLGGEGFATVGPLAFGTALEGDWRLDDDPDAAFLGGRGVPSRHPFAYVALETRLAGLFFGAVDRNWGPTWAEGLLFSPAPYSFDAFQARLGPRNLHLGIYATLLDDLPDAAGEPSNRYLVAHSFYWRLPVPLTVNVTEAILFTGPGRSLEPWYLNPLKLVTFTENDERGTHNNFIAGDFELALSGWPILNLSLYIDDLAAFVGEDEPPQGGLTLGATHPITPRVQLTAFYTAVSFLSYRARLPDERYTRRNLGIARNNSDYDQATVRVSVMPLPLVLLRPEITLVRQGEGDLRQPFPGDLSTAPTIHAGVTERLLRLGVDGRIDLPLAAHAVSVGFDAAYHRFTNAGHVAGARDSRFVGAIWGEVRFGLVGSVRGDTGAR